MNLKSFLTTKALQFVFHFRVQKPLRVYNGVIFTEKIPNEIITFCTDDNVAFGIGKT